jgi:hypothetical protein
MRKRVGQHHGVVHASGLIGAVCCLAGVSAVVAARRASGTTLAFTAASGTGGVNHFLLRSAPQPHLTFIDRAERQRAGGFRPNGFCCVAGALIRTRRAP